MLDVELVVAQQRSRARIAGKQRRHAVAPQAFQGGVCGRIDVDHLNRRAMRTRDRLDGGEHLVAQVAIRARKQRELQRSPHRGFIRHRC